MGGEARADFARGVRVATVRGATAPVAGCAGAGRAASLTYAALMAREAAASSAAT